MAEVKGKENLHLSITVRASVERAFGCINDVSKWWAIRVEGRSEKCGDVFTVRFHHMFVTFRIIESIPWSKVVWLVIDCSMPWLRNSREWNGTNVSFSLKEENGSTRIDFAHIGLIPAIECYDDCVYGWNLHFKQSLRALIEKGEGEPAY